MKRKKQGSYKVVSTAGEKVRAFIPNPLPPTPPIDWTPSLRKVFDDALLVLGKLDGVSSFMPDTSLFLYMYIRKEALLSSMIEGTQSSLSDLLLYESEEEPGVPIGDVEEVSNYVAALNYGLERLHSGFPLSLRLIREIHGILLAGGRGSDKLPGEFRRSQNWIGGSRPGNAVFVPPPPEKVDDCMSKLELFLHDKPETTSALVKAALAHVQFETIHPFLDGNGRLGRLLITLLLCDNKILSEPMLYLSLYFKSNRQDYYHLLSEVRSKGNWEEWLFFFAEAVISTANQALDTTRELIELTKSDEEKIFTLGRASVSANEVYRFFLKTPLATQKSLTAKTGLTPATVNKSLKHLEDLNILKEVTSQKRNRIFSYSRYIEILDFGTESL